MPRLTTAEREAAIESARRGAHAAQTIDPHDRKILDFAHMGSDPDDRIRRRLMADPLARDYARLTSPGGKPDWMADELALVRDREPARADHDRVMAGRSAQVADLGVTPALTDEQREAIRRLMVAEDRWRDR